MLPTQDAPQQNRISRFWTNIGRSGRISIALVSVAFFFVWRRDLAEGRLLLSLLVFGSAFVSAYLLRNIMVSNLQIAGWALNAFLVVGLMLSFVGGKALDLDPEPTWFRLTLSGFIGTYLGCYYWLHSDPRIEPA